MRSGFAPPPAKAGGGWEGVPTVRADLKATHPQPSPAFHGAWGGAGKEEWERRSGFAPPPAKAGGGWEGVPTVRADLKDTPPQPSPAFAGEGAGSDAHGTHAARSRSAVSNAIGPSGSPRRNCSTSGSPVASSSDGVPENTIFPLAITIARSATGSVSCTWWVTMMLVRPRLSLRREIRLMITPDAIGSSPVSGSS